MHHVVQTRDTRRAGVSSAAVDLFHPRRGTKHQKLQVATLANPTQFQRHTSAVVDRHAVAKQFDGTVVADAFSHAESV